MFLLTDGGLHQHLAASGNFGQVIRKNYPVIVGNKVEGNEREIVSVVGPLCTPLDLLADEVEMAKANVGDLIVVFQSGRLRLDSEPNGVSQSSGTGRGTGLIKITIWQPNGIHPISLYLFVRARARFAG